MKPVAKDKRVELLFEVGCEEIPAGMLPKAEKSFALTSKSFSPRKPVRRRDG